MRSPSFRLLLCLALVSAASATLASPCAHAQEAPTPDGPPPMSTAPPPEPDDPTRAQPSPETLKATDDRTREAASWIACPFQHIMRM